MTPFALPDPEMAALATHIRTLRPPDHICRKTKILTTSSVTLERVIPGGGMDDLQLRTDDGRATSSAATAIVFAPSPHNPAPLPF